MGDRDFRLRKLFMQMNRTIIEYTESGNASYIVWPRYKEVVKSEAGEVSRDD